MRDEAITALDPVVDEVEKMAQLCATVGEAAGHAAAHPGSAPEMRALIREAVEQLGEKEQKMQDQKFSKVIFNMLEQFLTKRIRKQVSF